MRRVFTILIACIPVMIFAWLFVLDIRPSGVLRAVYEPGGKASPYIRALTPAERLETVHEDGEVYMRIVDDPVYFTVQAPPADFEAARVSITFRPNGARHVGFGPAGDVAAQAFDLRPAYSVLLESLDWPRVVKDGVTLFDRHQTYTSLDDFFASPPNRARVATYGASLDAPVRLASYSPALREQTFDIALRGTHKYITYIKNETLEIRATYIDVNQTTGRDDVGLRVRNEAGEIVAEVMHENGSDGVIQLRKEGLPEGVYEVELVGTSDIIWQSFTTTQRYFSFIEKFDIAGDVSTTFYTDAKDLVMETSLASGVQNVVIGSQSVAIEQSHDPVRYHISGGGAMRGFVPLGNMRVVGDGVFAPASEAYFNPRTIRFGADIDLDERNIDYILTSYGPEQLGGGWMKATNVYEVAPYLDEGRVITFAISAPYIEDNDASVDIARIEIIFEKERLGFGGFIQAILDRTIRRL